MTIHFFGRYIRITLQILNQQLNVERQETLPPSTPPENRNQQLKSTSRSFLPPTFPFRNFIKSGVYSRKSLYPYPCSGYYPGNDQFMLRRVDALSREFRPFFRMISKKVPLSRTLNSQFVRLSRHPDPQNSANSSLF